MSNNAEPCYCAYGAVGGHQRTARCFQGPYPAFAVPVAKARGNPRPPDSPIRFTGEDDCQFAGEAKPTSQTPLDTR